MRRKNMEERSRRILSASFDRPPGQRVAEKLAYFREENKPNYFVGTWKICGRQAETWFILSF